METCGDVDIITLQYATNPVTGPWIDPGGFVAGAGTDMVLFDPAGSNGVFTYRAVRTESILPDRSRRISRRGSLGSNTPTPAIR